MYRGSNTNKVKVKRERLEKSEDETRRIHYLSTDEKIETLSLLLESTFCVLGGADSERTSYSSLFGRALVETAQKKGAALKCSLSQITDYYNSHSLLTVLI